MIRRFLIELVVNLKNHEVYLRRVREILTIKTRGTELIFLKFFDYSILRCQREVKRLIIDILYVRSSNEFRNQLPFMRLELFFFNIRRNERGQFNNDIERPS